MTHYQKEDWHLYRDNELHSTRRSQMEAHLLKCDLCLETYLSAVGEQEEREAGLLLPDDFTSKVVQNVMVRSKKKRRRERSRLMIHYVAAASITLMLMAGGMFDMIAREVPAVLRESSSFSQALDSVTSQGWSDQLVKATSTGLNNLWDKDKEEDRSK